MRVVWTPNAFLVRLVSAVFDICPGGGLDLSWLRLDYNSDNIWCNSDTPSLFPTVNSNSDSTLGSVEFNTDPVLRCNSSELFMFCEYSVFFPPPPPLPPTPFVCVCVCFLFFVVVVLGGERETKSVVPLWTSLFLPPPSQTSAVNQIFTLFEFS